MGVELNQDQALCLDRYASLMEKWNKGMNLVSRQDIGRLVPRHLLDSLGAVPFLHGKELLDIGTGPGLPGLPLAIAKPDMQVTLWERMARRVRFLQQTCRELGLTNVVVQERDLHQTNSGPAAKTFDVIVARAVAPIDELWPVMCESLNARGRLIVYSRVADQDLPAREPEQGLQPQEASYRVPGLDKIHYLHLMPPTQYQGV